MKRVTCVNVINISHTDLKICQCFIAMEKIMYCGKNPSALKSREWIRKAMLELLKERKYAQITIKDICKKADLSRQTFYQIYDSKDEVMEYHFKELFLEFKEQCSDFLRNHNQRYCMFLFLNFFMITGFSCRNSSTIICLTF